MSVFGTVFVSALLFMRCLRQKSFETHKVFTSFLYKLAQTHQETISWLKKNDPSFLKSDPSFFVNRRVVLWSESVHSFSLLWHLWQQKMQNPCNTRVCVYARAREKVFLAKWRRNTKQCCTKVSKLFWGEWCQWKGDTNRVQQALCFLLLLSNLSDSKTIYILSGIESTSLKIVGIQNRFCSFSLIFHSFPYYLPLYICRTMEHRIQTIVLFAYGHKKWDTTVSQPC